MSAITPFLNNPPENADEQQEALGDLGEADRTKPDLNVSHAELTRMVFIRRTIEEELSSRRFWIEEEGGAGSELVMRIEPGLPADTVPWFPGPVANTNRVKLWGEAAKMSCPTFDLPAGAALVGGACPGALAAQTIIPESERLKVLESRLTAQGLEGRALAAKTPAFDGPPRPEWMHPLQHGDINEPFRAESAICQICVTGDSRVLVQGVGVVEIRDLAGTEFIAWSGVAWRQTRAVLNGIRPVLRLSTNWGATLGLTKEHPVIVDGGRYGKDTRVEAGDLEIGDPLIHSPPPEPPFPAKKRIDHGIPDGKVYQTACESKYPAEWSKDLGVFLGYIVGTASDKRRRSPSSDFSPASPIPGYLPFVTIHPFPSCVGDLGVG